MHEWEAGGLGGEASDVVELLLEAGVLHAQLLLVKVVLDGGWAIVVEADDVLECLAHGDVLAPDLVDLHAEKSVVLPLVLLLPCQHNKHWASRFHSVQEKVENQTMVKK